MSYLRGLALLGLSIAPLVVAAIRIRRRFLPRWRSAPARLVEIILTLSLLIVIAEVLGTFGQFRRVATTITCVLVGAAVSAIGRPAPALEPATQPPVPHGGAVLLALSMSAIVMAQWFVRAFQALTTGFTEYDTLHYHLPMAARFFQSGWTSRLHFINPEFPNVFHPLNSELFHTFGMLWFGRDVISPLLNVGWMVVVLLACWCIGRPWGLGPSTLLGGVVLLSQPLAVGQAGTALSDIAGVALFLAAVALLLQPDRDRAATVVAAAAAGLSLGTKLPFIAPVALLTIALILVAPGMRRIRAAWAWTLPLLATGSYWYLRNLVRVGSPIPSVRIGIGSASLPRARFIGLDRLGFSVSHYLGNAAVWRDWFLPGLDRAFGPLWWFALPLAGLGMIWALVSGETPLIRALGVVGILASGAYLVTPGGALGPEGQPFIFVSALRYSWPSLALGFVLLPLVPTLRRAARQWLVLLAFTAAIIGAQTSRNFPAWQGANYREAIFLGVLAAALAGMLLAFRRGVVSARTVAVVIVVVLELGLAAGFFAQRTFVSDRFKGNPLARLGSRLHDKRIAFVGARGYPLFGADLTNDVQYVGHRGPHGEFHSVGSCVEWQRLVRAGGFSFILLMPDYRPVPGLRPVWQGELPWTRLDPDARELAATRQFILFRFHASTAGPRCGPAPT